MERKFSELEMDAVLTGCNQTRKPRFMKGMTGALQSEYGITFTHRDTAAFVAFILYCDNGDLAPISRTIVQFVGTDGNVYVKSRFPVFR